MVFAGKSTPGLEGSAMLNIAACAARFLAKTVVVVAIGIGVGAACVWLFAPTPTPWNSSPPPEPFLFIEGFLLWLIVYAAGRVIYRKRARRFTKPS
jgi:hypothetical protein